MSEVLERPVSVSAPAIASDSDAIVMSPTYDGIHAWHEYSVEHGKEGSLSSLGNPVGYGPANWNVHGLWRG